MLLILTDVKKVQRGYGSLMPEDIDRMTVVEAEALLKRGEFGAGSMGPKVEAAVRFVAGGTRAVIAELDQARAALAGDAGTEIVADAVLAARGPAGVPELLGDHEEREEARRSPSGATDTRGRSPRGSRCVPEAAGQACRHPTGRSEAERPVG